MDNKSNVSQIEDMSEVMSGQNGVLIDPKLLLVSRSPTSRSVSLNSSRSNISICSSPNDERLQFGLAWLNLTYSPKSFISKEKKTILRNVSGQIKFGEILGLMGPSGSGKSTLLRCINGRIASGLSAETKIYVSTTRDIHTCFLVQDQKEHLLMNLTTKEVLLFASKIRNTNYGSDDDSEDEFDHNANVGKLMTDLTLNDCAHTMISNCSGGQQKRIVIALELVAQNKPNIMCIDEPTSGLDSNAAEQVIECLRDVCREHSIGIATTIHQPNADILYMFDSLYVLSKGGYCVYNDRPQNLRAFILEANIALKDIQVPIEVLMKLASKTTFSETNSEEFQVGEDIKILAERTRIREMDLSQKCYSFGKFSDPKNITIKSIGFSFGHFWVLLNRAVKSGIIRGWKTILFLTLFDLGSGLFNAYLFGKPGVDGGCVNFDPYGPVNLTCAELQSMALTKNEPAIVKNFKLLYFLMATHSFLMMCFTVLTYPIEVMLFINEQHNRWYSTGAYFWAKNLTDAFIGIFITILFVTPVYVMSGQRGVVFGQYYGWFLLSNVLAVFAVQGMASTASILAVRNFRVCLILGVGGLMLNTLLSGFLVPVKEMDPIIQSISYIAFNRMAFETQVYILYGFSRCDPNQNQWSLVLYQFGFTEEGFYRNLYLLIVWALFWRLLALVCLIIKANDWNLSSIKNGYQKRNSRVIFVRNPLEMI